MHSASTHKAAPESMTGPSSPSNGGRLWPIQIIGSSSDKTAPPLLGTVRDLSSGKRVEIGGTSVRLLGDKFRDYRQQLIPWDQFKREVSAYGEQTGIPTEAKQFVQSLQEKLIS